MKKTVYLLLTILFVALSGIAAFADLGDFNDYDSYDYDDSGYDYDYDYDNNDYGGGYDNYRNYSSPRVYHSSGGSGSASDIVAAVIVVIIIVIVVSKKNKKGNSPVVTQRRTSRPSDERLSVDLPDYTEAITAAIIKNDADFSSEKFIAFVKEVFFTLQNAWSERESEKLRPFEKEELYKQHEMQIKKYIENNRINVLDRINVNRTFLYRYVRDNEYEYLTVYIQSRMTDYIKNALTGEILKGDPDTDCHMNYLYTFMRKTGVLTDPAKTKSSVVACPNCGAPTSITSAGKCEYCGFIVTTGEFDWVLSDIVAVKKGSQPVEGGVFIRDNTNDVGGRV